MHHGTFEPVTVYRPAKREPAYQPPCEHVHPPRESTSRVWEAGWHACGRCGKIIDAAGHVVIRRLS